MLISSFQFYVIIYYVFGGDKVLGAEYAGYAGTLGAISTFAVIVFVTWLGTKIGKRRAFFVATGVSMVGYALKWVCYNPEIPWLLLLPAPLLAFGLGGLFTLMPSMIADVVDMDELKTHERREGMYGSIFWWVVKLGMAAALAAGGFLLNATGFDVALEGNQAQRTITLMRLFDAFVPFVASASPSGPLRVSPSPRNAPTRSGWSSSTPRQPEGARLSRLLRPSSRIAPSGSGQAPGHPPGEQRGHPTSLQNSTGSTSIMSRKETIALYRGAESLPGYISADISDEDLRCAVSPGA